MVVPISLQPRRALVDFLMLLYFLGARSSDWQTARLKKHARLHSRSYSETLHPDLHTTYPYTIPYISTCPFGRRDGFTLVKTPCKSKLNLAS